jgi:hypothetical protein
MHGALGRGRPRVRHPADASTASDGRSTASDGRKHGMRRTSPRHPADAALLYPLDSASKNSAFADPKSYQISLNPTAPRDRQPCSAKTRIGMRYRVLVMKGLRPGGRETPFAPDRKKKQSALGALILKINRQDRPEERGLANNGGSARSVPKFEGRPGFLASEGRPCPAPPQIWTSLRDRAGRVCGTASGGRSAFVTH